MASQIPSWLTAPETWNRCVLNNRTIPGVVKVKYDAKSGLTVRKPPKGHYAAIVDQGHPPISGSLLVTFGFAGREGYGSAEEQWSAWQGLVEEVFPGRRKTRNAYAITHPALALAGISRVYVTNVSSPDGEGPRARKAVIKFLEYGKVISAASGSVNAGPSRPIGAISLSSLDAAPASAPSASESDP